MEIKYVVIVTVYSVDGLRTSRHYNFGANVNAAHAFADKEEKRPLLLCDTRRIVRMRMMPV